MTDFIALIPLHHERGWVGAFTRAQAPGAIENGAEVVKVQTELGDTNPVGTKGAVLGSLLREGVHFYFVEWANAPRIAVGVMGWKIARA